MPCSNSFRLASSCSWLRWGSHSCLLSSLYRPQHYLFRWPVRVKFPSSLAAPQLVWESWLFTAVGETLSFSVQASQGQTSQTNPPSRGSGDGIIIPFQKHTTLKSNKFFTYQQKKNCNQPEIFHSNSDFRADPACWEPERILSNGTLMEQEKKNVKKDNDLQETGRQHGSDV